MGVAQSQCVEFGGLEDLVVVVGLVGHQNHFFLGASKNAGHSLVEVGDAGAGIHQEEYHIGLFRGHGHLLAYLLLEDVIAVDHPSSGIHYREFVSCPFTLSVLAVARGTRLVAHDGVACLCETVEKGGLSYVGPSDNSY